MLDIRNVESSNRLEIANDLPGNFPDFGTASRIGPGREGEPRSVLAGNLHVSPFQRQDLIDRQPGSVQNRAERNVEQPALAGSPLGFKAGTKLPELRGSRPNRFGRAYLPLTDIAGRRRAG